MSKVKVGTVVSNKMVKTVVVKVESKIKHPLYKKLIKRTSKFKVHDEIGLTPGQKVKIIETKPFSKGVYFKVLEVVK